MSSIPAVAEMPSPPEVPLYVSVDKAARLAGVSYELMATWANSAVAPIPHIAVGKSKKLIRVAAIPEYAKRKEAV